MLAYHNIKFLTLLNYIMTNCTGSLQYEIDINTYYSPHRPDECWLFLIQCEMRKGHVPFQLCLLVKSYQIPFPSSGSFLFDEYKVVNCSL